VVAAAGTAAAVEPPTPRTTVSASVEMAVTCRYSEVTPFLKMS
jgi:hypothetical protein